MLPSLQKGRCGTLLFQSVVSVSLAWLAINTHQPIADLREALVINQTLVGTEIG